MDVVLAETVWMLADQRYRATQSDLIVLINCLLQDANVCFEDDEVVWSALQAFCWPEADFAAALIVCKAQNTATDDGELSAFYTFFDAYFRCSVPQSGSACPGLLVPVGGLPASLRAG